MKIAYQIGYFDETPDGPRWRKLKLVKCEHDAQAEAEVDQLRTVTPTTLDGDERHGLYLKRGKIKWFRRFSCHA